MRQGISWKAHSDSLRTLKAEIVHSMDAKWKWKGPETQQIGMMEKVLTWFLALALIFFNKYIFDILMIFVVFKHQNIRRWCMVRCLLTWIPKRADFLLACSPTQENKHHYDFASDAFHTISVYQTYLNLWWFFSIYRSIYAFFTWAIHSYLNQARPKVVWAKHDQVLS